MEPFFLRGGGEVAGKKKLSDFVPVFDDLGGLVEMVMIVKPMVKMILLMERLMMKISGEEVAKEKIRCKYLPPHSHSFSKEQNLHLLESTD